MLIDYQLTQTGIILRVKILNSSVATGAGLTGLTNSSAGLNIAAIADVEASTTAYTSAGSTIDAVTTLGTYSAPSANHCSFKQVDSTNHPGVYEIQLANARYAVTNAKSLLVSITGATNAADCDALIPLRAVNPYDAVRGGMSALPNAAAAANGGLPTVDASNNVHGIQTRTVSDASVIGTSTLTQTLVSGYAGPILTDNSTGLVRSTDGAGNALATATSVAAIKAQTDKVVFDGANNVKSTPQTAVTTTYPIKRNTAIANFAFLMYDSSGEAAPGLTVTGQVSIDGSAFGATTNAPSNLSNGVYLVALAAADLDGTIVTLRFSATGATDTFITIPTQS